MDRRALIVFFSSFYGACSLPDAATPIEVRSQQDRFPADWCGIWAGELVIHGPKTVVQRLPMELHIEARETRGATEEHDWRIVFGKGDARQVRDYVLRGVKPEGGIYEIDELDSIILPSTYRGGALAQRFAVGDTLIQSSYQREGDTIRFELMAGPRVAVQQTGGEDRVPVVDGFEIRNRQGALLRRQRAVGTW